MRISRRFFPLLFFVTALFLVACQDLPVAEGTAAPVTAARTEVAATGEPPASPVAATDMATTVQPPASDTPPARPDLSGAAVQPEVPGATPGQTVVLNGTGFPPNTPLKIGIGPVASEYQIIDSVETDAGGNFTIQVAVPDATEVRREYVFVAQVDTDKVISEPFLIVPSEGDSATRPAATQSAPAPSATPSSGAANIPVEGQFVRTQLFLVALEDGGKSGQLIGCNDSLVPVEIVIEPTIAPMTAALQQLLAIESQFYGQSGLYNALYQSDLSLQGIDINSSRATIALTGELVVGGACDAPRIEAQLQQIALQYSTIDAVQVLINGQPLEQILSTQ